MPQCRLCPVEYHRYSRTCNRLRLGHIVDLLVNSEQEAAESTTVFQCSCGVSRLKALAMQRCSVYVIAYHRSYESRLGTSSIGLTFLAFPRPPETEVRIMGLVLGLACSYVSRKALL